MKIVFIGAGNVAFHLSRALQNAGYEIIQVYNRTESSAKELANLLQTSYTASIDDISRDASLYVFSVSDAAIKPVSERLALNGKIAIHLSGSVEMNVFEKHYENFGVFYPLQTFSKSRTVDFSEVPVFLEANNSKTFEILYSAANKISQKAYRASSEDRRKLHMAAVFGCNFVNHLLHISATIAQQAGFDFNALKPLLCETIDKAIASKCPKSVQTGPAYRNDGEVIRKHLELLSAEPEVQQIYKLLSDNILKYKLQGDE